MVYLLYDKIFELQPEIDKNLKKYIMHEIDSQFNSIENIKLLTTVLDPRFKKMYFRSNLACANAISKIDKQINKRTRQNNECDRVESPGRNRDDFKSMEQA